MPKRFVQFPHPKDEAGPDRQAWLRGDTRHRRYFVVAEATYRRAVDAPDERGLVTAWVEWEAATECRKLPHGGAPGSPEWLHRPISPASLPATERIPQNTDPLVFGGRFLSTFCGQTGGTSRPGLLELERGSVIVFGSRPNYRWVADTVLVVAESVEHRRDDYETMLSANVTDLATALTLRPMYAWPNASGPFNAMFGATAAQPVDGMFSFVPCLPADGALRGFARPDLSRHPAINPKNTQAVSQNRRISSREFPLLWQQVAETVTASGLALATRFDPPPEDVFEQLPMAR